LNAVTESGCDCNNYIGCQEIIVWLSHATGSLNIYETETDLWKFLY